MTTLERTKQAALRTADLCTWVEGKNVMALFARELDKEIEKESYSHRRGVAERRGDPIPKE